MNPTTRTHDDAFRDYEGTFRRLEQQHQARLRRIHRTEIAFKILIVAMLLLPILFSFA